ncbi:MAG TPA: shikimate kinase [Acidimicrobiales bacterium]|nr:shikimate kinase [Acidimicrobiales bacterium]
MSDASSATERVWLIGMMGSGKSTVGRMLAEMTGRPFTDTDRLIEQERGATVAELFERDGEPAFRSYEKAAIEKVAATPGPWVVSVGGGAPLGEDNRVSMSSSGVVVWLRASAPTLVARLGRGEGRPVLARGAEEGLRARVDRLLAEREPVYSSLAAIVVDVDHCGSGQVARAVMRRLADW